ncbi:MAG: AlpA family transcriptional regulator [Alphaproteobacteria bacterium]|nr:AlpA family transcriptional regulator [Alphaproteobacteria bacterium]
MNKNTPANCDKDPALSDLPLFSSSRTTSPLKILRLPEVIARVGLKRASIYHHISEGNFPKPVPLGPRAVGWLEHEIDEWLRLRLEERGGRRYMKLD